jgi:hypothetical protein
VLLERGRRGDLLAGTVPPTPREHLHVAMEITLTIRCVAGPDAGWVTRLRPGTHWLGRIHGDLQMLDPSVEAHHALVEMGRDGRVRLLQLAGRSPIRVDGDPAHGWVRLGHASVIEVGASRLELVDPTSLPIGSTTRVYAPLDESDGELRRFERDVVRAAEAARAHGVEHRSPGAVAVGIADMRLPIDVLDNASKPADIAALPLPAAAVLDRHGRAERPVIATIAPDRPLAIAGIHAESVARRVSVQLTPRHRARLLTVAALEADRFRGSGRPMIVVASGVDDVPSWCVGVLDVGETWHGTWQPDVIERPEEIVRLHVAGASLRRACAIPTTLPDPVTTDVRVGSGADVLGTVVAQQVSRPGAELGSDVTRVPQSAR